MEKFNWSNLNYENHPAFRTLVFESSYNEKLIEEKILDINNTFKKIEDENITSNKHLEELILSIKESSEQIKFEIEKGCKSTLIKAHINEIFNFTIRQIIFDLRLIFNQKKFKPFELNDNSRENLINLQRNGVTTIDLKQEDLKKINQFSLNLLIEAREKYKSKLDWMSADPLKRGTMEFSFFRELGEKYEISKIVSNYKKINMKLFYIALDFAAERRSWYKDCYKDFGIENESFRYFHYDFDFNVSKFIIYLSDVGLENGPFTFVQTSTHSTPSVFPRYFSFGMERIINFYLSKKGEKGNYYRPAFISNRKDFYELPKSLRIWPHFGDDITSDDNLAEQINKFRKEFTGQTGTSILFDGFKGIHRGGLVNRGERLALQFAFIEKKQLSLNKRIEKKIKNIFFKNIY